MGQKGSRFVCKYQQVVRFGGKPGIASPCETIDGLLEGSLAPVEKRRDERHMLDWKSRLRHQRQQRLLATIVHRTVGCNDFDEDKERVSRSQIDKDYVGKILVRLDIEPDRPSQFLMPRHHLVAALAAEQNCRVGEEGGRKVLDDGLRDLRAWAGAHPLRLAVRKPHEHIIATDGCALADKSDTGKLPRVQIVAPPRGDGWRQGGASQQGVEKGGEAPSQRKPRTTRSRCDIGAHDHRSKRHQALAQGFVADRLPRRVLIPAGAAHRVAGFHHVGGLAQAADVVGQLSLRVCKAIDMLGTQILARPFHRIHIERDKDRARRQEARAIVSVRSSSRKYLLKARTHLLPPDQAGQRHESSIPYSFIKAALTAARAAPRETCASIDAMASTDGSGSA